MRFTIIALLAITVFSIPRHMTAQETEPDAEGCQDSKLLSRMPGCSIGSCERRVYDEARVQVANAASEDDPAGIRKLEGQKELIEYHCPENLSGLQILRNAENALRQAGYTIVYSGESYINQIPVVTARKGAQWIEVLAGVPAYDGVGYVQTAVQVKEMEQILEATADSLEAEINKTGHVAVYGINFDTGKATLKPESEKVLGEVLTLLKKNPDWRLRVEGHTDNVGAKAANQKLSEQRAAAVVAWLAKSGIDPSHLTSQGFGDTRPLADNSTEEGRAKNRRVELAKQ